MPVFRHEDATIGYSVQGEGPALLLTHSLMCNRSMWEPIAQELSRFFRVISMDFRGHGESSADGAFTLDDLVGDCVAVLQRENVQNCTVCGVSMGGMVAMRLALRARFVSKLVLVDTTLRSEPLLKRLRYGALILLYKRFGLLPLIARRVQGLMLGSTTLNERPVAVAQFMQMLSSCDRSQLSAAIQTVAFRPALRGAEAIRCPTLVIVGDEDVVTPRTHSEELKRTIPGSRLVVLKGSGHLSPIEVSSALLVELLEFLGYPASSNAPEKTPTSQLPNERITRQAVPMETHSATRR